MLATRDTGIFIGVFVDTANGFKHIRACAHDALASLAPLAGGTVDIAATCWAGLTLWPFTPSSKFKWILPTLRFTKFHRVCTIRNNTDPRTIGAAILGITGVFEIIDADFTVGTRPTE